MLFSVPQDRPLGVQLLGCEPQFVLKGIDALNRLRDEGACNFDILDFNAACPAKKVIRRGEGSSLMKEPKKLAGLLRLVIRNTQLPVTVKIRSGWDDNCLNAPEVAVRCQDEGVAAVFLHGRTRSQGYHGKVSYEVIRKTKERLSIPLIASGDILSAPLAAKMFDETGCDAVAVARGSLGNPWIFKQCEELLKKGRVITDPAPAEIRQIMRLHLGSCIGFYAERTGVMIFRKFFSWYTRGFRKIRHLREKSSRAKTEKEMLHLIESVSD